MGSGNKYRHQKECDYCGTPFETNIEHKVYCSKECKKTFENEISTIMKGVRPMIIKALKKMRNDRRHSQK